jgi:hypothetical protein
MSPLLHVLTTDDFTDGVGVVLPPSPLRHVLQRAPHVRRIGAALRYGQITEQDIRVFVAQLLREFKPGELFRHDIALAALAVAMEHCGDRFAEEYLIDLARVERPEFRAAYRVARECLKARYAFPQTQVRMARYPSGAKTSTSGHHRIRALRIQQYQGQTLTMRQIRSTRYTEASHAKS